MNTESIETTDGKKKVKEHTIRDAAEALLKESHPVLAYSEIVKEIRAQFPEANTTRSSIRWYASQMKGRGENLPIRPIDTPRRAAGAD